MIRVLNVVLDNEIGGPQLRVLSVAKELRKYEIETIMLSPKGDGGFAQRARDEHFKVYQIMLYGPKYFNSFFSVLANFRWFLLFPLSVLIIAKIIKKERIDTVHTNGLLNLQAPVAGLITRRKIAWHLISSLYPKILVLFLRPFIRIIADQIVVVAEKLGEYYLGSKIKSTDTNISIIYESVDVNKFDPSKVSKKDINKLKREFGIQSSEKVIGCIGNISAIKGYEYFIESTSIIKKERDNIKFLIVGSISNPQKGYYQKLKNLIEALKMKQEIIFTGKRDDIPQILSLFDVFLLTSIDEGTPLVILEAMAMEKPIVATDVGGISEQIIDGGAGILVPPKSSKTIAEAVIHLLKHPEERIRMGKKARKRVKDIFSLEKCVEEHKRLYECVY